MSFTNQGYSVLEPFPVTVIPIVQMLSLFPSQEARSIPSVDC